MNAFLEMIPIGTSPVPVWAICLIALLFIATMTIGAHAVGARRFAPRNNFYGLAGFILSLLLLGLCVAYIVGSIGATALLTGLAVAWFFYIVLLTRG